MPLTTVTFLASASSTGTAITIPVTAQAGDVAVLFDAAQNTSGGAPADVTPSGWTGLVMATANNERARSSFKILAPGDAGASITGMTSTLTRDKLMLVFRGDEAIISVTPSTWLAEVTNLDPASQAINASGQSPPLLVLAGAQTFSGTAAFSVETPAFDATVASPDLDVLGGYTIYDVGETPVNHTVDMADLGQNALVSGYLILQGLADVAFAGTAAIAFSQTGALRGGAAGAGTATLVFAQTGAFAARGAFAGTVPTVFDQTGDFVAGSASGDAAFVGTAAITFAQTGALLSSSAYSGTSAIIFDQTGDFVAGGANASFVGTTSITFSQTGAVASRSAFAGSVVVTFSATIIDFLAQNSRRPSPLPPETPETTSRRPSPLSPETPDITPRRQP